LIGHKYLKEGWLEVSANGKCRDFYFYVFDDMMVMCMEAKKKKSKDSKVQFQVVRTVAMNQGNIR
jgi:hypothetical protein